MRYIDIHTHKDYDNPDVLYIKNADLDTETIENSKHYSIGLHPWDVKNDTDTHIYCKLLESLIAHPSIVCIGECGLDKSIQTDFEVQKRAFHNQIVLAKIYSKPLVIHCVRSYYDVLSLLQKEKFALPIIFHKYSGNVQITEALLKQNSFFSFGAELMNNEKCQQLFRTIPLSHIFLETDVSEIHISELYSFAAELRQIPIDDFMIEIERNYLKLTVDPSAGRN